MRIIEAVRINVDLDPFLSMNGVLGYLSLSRRMVQNLLGDPLDPLPSYRIGSKLLFRRSEIDAWMSRRRNRKATAVADLAAADAAALLIARPR
jgi:predicted DNA-binding transcriptional regulator AlpA